MGDKTQEKRSIDMRIYRQGDVLLVRTEDSRPEGSIRKPINGRVILVEGEATGHHHSVSAVCDVIDADGRMWMVAPKNVELTHQEHGTIEIEEGTYWVVRQRVYSPESIRTVLD